MSRILQSVIAIPRGADSDDHGFIPDLSDTEGALPAIHQKKRSSRKVKKGCKVKLKRRAEIWKFKCSNMHDGMSKTNVKSYPNAKMISEESLSSDQYKSIVFSRVGWISAGEGFES